MSAHLIYISVVIRSAVTTLMQRYNTCQTVNVNLTAGYYEEIDTVSGYVLRFIIKKHVYISTRPETICFRVRLAIKRTSFCASTEIGTLLKSFKTNWELSSVFFF